MHDGESRPLSPRLPPPAVVRDAAAAGGVAQKTSSFLKLPEPRALGVLEVHRHALLNREVEDREGEVRQGVADVDRVLERPREAREPERRVVGPARWPHSDGEGGTRRTSSASGDRIDLHGVRVQEALGFLDARPQAFAERKPTACLRTREDSTHG